MDKLYIDIETYCELELKDVGVYKYVKHPSFEILLIGYAFNSEPVRIFEAIENLPEDFELFGEFINSKDTQPHAHNANFERVCFKQIGIDRNDWRCTMIKSAYCGLPLKLDDVAKALNIEGKLKAGTSLINYFCKPCKPTKANGGRTRNLPEHDPEKWELFKEYCKQDVEIERQIDKTLGKYEIPAIEYEYYQLDQEINDRGILIDLDFANQARSIDLTYKTLALTKINKLTNLDNPNSLPQLKKWILQETGKEVESLSKEYIDPLIEELGAGVVTDVLKLRKKLSKTSVAKYETMVSMAGEDNRARGLFQFYGANRTGRWAGRGVQMQNLPKNKIKDLDLARQIIKEGNLDTIGLLFDNVPNILSQLIRTAFIAPPGKIFAVADFKAIEAVVLSWLANEEWRLEVFRTHGKLYEASAAKMFNVPIEKVTKGSELRQRGKVAELALGYQGSVGAMVKMGADKMGLNDDEMKLIVDKWRLNNPMIVKLWKQTENLAKMALRNRNTTFKGPAPVFITYLYDGTALQIGLPSGRKLFYWSPMFTTNKFDQQSIKYRGTNQDTKQWGWVDTYGGKFVENIVQAISRDLLANSMKNVNSAFEIVLHVHDEIAVETGEYTAKEDLKYLYELMLIAPDWVKDLPLGVDGYLTKYYKKDD